MKGETIMEKQIVIALGREYGSGGHEIAEKIAEAFNISLYDRNLLDIVAKENNMDVEEVKKFDEKSRNLFLSRKVNGYSNAIEDMIAEMQFKYLRERVEAGESLIVVGRCGEYALKDCDKLISVFIYGDEDKKLARLVEKYNVSKDDAEEQMKHIDKKRKDYHNSLVEGKWGEPHTYDLCVNSSSLGVEKTAEMLVEYIKEFA